jgi:hypothetical protein
VANFISTGQPPKDWYIAKHPTNHRNPFSRKLEVILPDGQMLVIGGVLIQDKDLNNRNGKERICSLPNPNVTLNQALAKLRLKPQGYSAYHTDTRAMTHHVSEGVILGGYTKEGLEEKLSIQTMAEEVLQGLDVILPKTIISGIYQDLNLGAFYAYLKPLTINMSGMIQIDKVIKGEGRASNVFSNAVFNMAQLVRQMHDRGLIHLELHIGNWGLCLGKDLESKNKIYIGDFETCCYDPDMPLEPKIQDLAVLMDSIIKPFQDNDAPIFNDSNYFDQVIFSLAFGYQNLEMDNKKRAYMFEKMLKYKKHTDTKKGMLVDGREYLSWMLRRIYNGFDLDEYIHKLGLK